MFWSFDEDELDEPPRIEADDAIISDLFVMSDLFLKKSCIQNYLVYEKINNIPFQKNKYTT
jgi:hypothetical protein